MFAGPNGSGKSTLKDALRTEILGYYVNADEIEASLRSDKGFDFATQGLSPSENELQAFFRSSTLLGLHGLLETAADLEFRNGALRFGSVEGNSYFAAVVADFVRRSLLSRGISFSFETVMSSRDKVSFLREAQRFGYRTYLYFVATEDPQINLSRVENRVRLGGHGVPANKVLERYERSLQLLPEAIRYSNRAYVFDNSGENVDRVWIAEFDAGATMELKTTRVPLWFKRAVLDEIDI